MDSQWTPDMDLNAEQKHASDIAKKLLERENPFGKTEMSERKVMLMTMCQRFAKEVHNVGLYLALQDWSENMMSHKRQSRTEFKDALSGIEGLNRMGNMFGMQGGNFGQRPPGRY